MFLEVEFEFAGPQGLQKAPAFTTHHQIGPQAGCTV